MAVKQAQPNLSKDTGRQPAVRTLHTSVGMMRATTVAELKNQAASEIPPPLGKEDSMAVEQFERIRYWLGVAAHVTDFLDLRNAMKEE